MCKSVKDYLLTQRHTRVGERITASQQILPVAEIDVYQPDESSCAIHKRRGRQPDGLLWDKQSEPADCTQSECSLVSESWRACACWIPCAGRSCDGVPMLVGYPVQLGRVMLHGHSNQQIVSNQHAP